MIRHPVCVRNQWCIPPHFTPHVSCSKNHLLISLLWSFPYRSIRFSRLVSGIFSCWVKFLKVTANPPLFSRFAIGRYSIHPLNPFVIESAGSWKVLFVIKQIQPLKWFSLARNEFFCFKLNYRTFSHTRIWLID